jgi:hypothetical protein
VDYVQRVSRIEHLARTYWFDLLIALLAIVAILDVVLGRGSSGAPTTTLWRRSSSETIRSSAREECNHAGAPHSRPTCMPLARMLLGDW